MVYYIWKVHYQSMNHWNNNKKLVKNSINKIKKPVNPKLFKLIFHITKNASVAQSGGARDL